MWDFDSHDVATFLIGFVVGFILSVVWLSFFIR
jgi:hypothetical protein